ncbi:hypothetical protein F4804DRAFT_354214 [Jackrogersella minutella]|nr:hypothetical protein F4804DRAFT_354214 [Jackrogersella minutella]
MTPGTPGLSCQADRLIDIVEVEEEYARELFVASSNPVQSGDAPDDIEAKMVFGTGGVDMFQKTLPAAFNEYLVEALEMGVYKVAPPPEVVSTKGLEGVQEALDILKKGVSGQRLAVEAK